MTSAPRWGLVCRKQLIPKKLLSQAPSPALGDPSEGALCEQRGPSASHQLWGDRHGLNGRVSLRKALGRRTHLPALLSKNVLNVGDETQGENKILQDHEGVGLGVRGEGNSFFPNFLADCN